MTWHLLLALLPFVIRLDGIVIAIIIVSDINSII
jgi:hypothetical protein